MMICGAAHIFLQSSCNLLTAFLSDDDDDWIFLSTGQWTVDSGTP